MVKVPTDFFLRVDAAIALGRFGEPNHQYRLLKLFLRGAEYKIFNIFDGMTEEDRKKLEMLSGPHGYTIWRAFLERNDIDLASIKRGWKR